MQLGEIARRRVAAQQIARHDFRSAKDVVAWLGAVQAQDYAGAKWAVGVRLREGAATDASIERALDEGEILRTHAMRAAVGCPAVISSAIAAYAPAEAEGGAPGG